MLLNEIQNNQFFTTYEQTKIWLVRMGIENYIINPKTLEVTVNDLVDLRDKVLDRIPVKFNHVHGTFDCGINQLTSLNGAPNSVGGSFLCYHNKLNTLQHSPQSVGDRFHCAHNNLKSLDGAPKQIGGGFICYHNQLETLRGIPTIINGEFDCCHNNLTSLQSGPTHVKSDFICSSNKLKSLQGLPPDLNTKLICNGSNDILSTINKFAKSIQSLTLMQVDPDVFSFMRVFLIKSLRRLTLFTATEEQKQVCNIINKHLQGDRSGPACQLELIDAGLGEYIKI